MKRLFIFLMFLVSVSITLEVTAQEKIIRGNAFNRNPEQSFTKYKNDPPLSLKDQTLLNQIIGIKNSSDISRQNELNGLLKKFNRQNGLIEKPPEPYNGKIFVSSGNGQNKTLSQTDLVYGGFTKSYAVATEQTGTGKGRAWIVYTHGTASTGGDTLEIYYASGNGSYTRAGWAVLASTDKFTGNLDAEIIEKNSGAQALYIFFTYYTSGTTIEKIGAVYYRLDIISVGFLPVIWPGQTNGEHYYNVHITSDNNVDSTTAWIYIACSMDSVAGNGNWFYGQKFAYISQTTPDPPNLPSITYKADHLPVYWQSGDQIERNLFTDIAYFRDGSNTPSLMFTYSNIPDSTKIWLTKSYFTGSGASLWGTLGSSYHIAFSSIAAPGGTGNQQLMVVCTQDWQNSGDWDLDSYKTNNGGANWSEVFIDGYTSTTDKLPSWPDLYIKWKDLDNYRVSYILANTVLWNTDSVMYVESVTSQANQWKAAVRVGTSNPFYNSPKVGFSGNGSDDSFVLWSYRNSSWLYATYQTMPSAVNEEKIHQMDYSLSNNYPNPFNPTTNFEFRIADFGFVSLKVYDVLGREVAALVNEEKPAGNYKITFDAKDLPSGVYFYRLVTNKFVQTKKMLLLK